MGMRNFRYRFIVLFCFSLVIWQSARYWPPAFSYGNNSSQPRLSSFDFGEKNISIHALNSPEIESRKKIPISVESPVKRIIQKVAVAVYYEALCPDSRNFVVKQLVPTFNKIPDKVQLELIPYGKAKTISTPNGYEFTCQHGPTECEANTIHACVVDEVIDPEIQLKFITCMIQDNWQPEKIMNECAVKVDVNVAPIEECFKGNRGKDLLAKFGEMTNNLNPKITFIPTISLNKDFSNQPAILKNLLKEVQKLIPKVTVAVYYEALCPDSRNFIVKQLVPTFQKIPYNVQVDLIPYGKAKTIPTPNGYEFTCQHGPPECEANTIHACVIDEILDPEIQLKFITCMIQDNWQPEKIMNECAIKVDVDVAPIEECFKGKRGKDLLAKFGEMTNNLNPKVGFIPTISLDKDLSNQPAILKNLLKEVCLKLKDPPPGCA